MAAVWRSLLRAGALVSAGVFLGRLAGLAREMVLAHKLGAGAPADLAVYALTLPDVFTNLLVAGAVGGALVPEFKASPESARALFRRATAASLAAFGVLAGLGALAGPWLARALMPGFDPASAAAAAGLGAVALAAVPLSAAAAVSTAYLQARDRFALPALGTLIFNGGLLVVLLAWVTPERLFPLAAGVTAAAAIRWLTQAIPAAALPAPAGDARLTAPLIRRYVQTLASFGVPMLVVIATRALASGHGPGAVAAVNYALKIVELPMGVAVGVLGVVLLPRFAELHARGADAESAALARQGIWLVWVIALPATLGLAWYAPPVVDLLFGHGRMSEPDAERVATLSAIGLLGLPAQGLCALLFGLFTARKDAVRPLRAGFVLCVLFLGAAVVLRRPFGLAGLVAAGSGFFWLLAAAYLFILRKSHGLDILPASLARDLAVTLLASGAGFLPAALRVGRTAPAARGAAAALVGGGLALAAALLPGYRTLPDGLRTFTRARSV